MKYSFSDLFQENADGSAITPRRIVRIGNATLSGGITFRKGVLFSGVDIFQIRGHAIEAEDEGGTLVIKGYYPRV